MAKTDKLREGHCLPPPSYHFWGATMGFVRGIYSGLLGLWIHIGERIFPPTIHPMLVHFPIVLLYLALLADILSRVVRSPDRFFERSSFWLIILGLIAGVVAAAAGVISEQFVKWTPTTISLLSAHQRDAVLTGVLVIAALVSRWLNRYPLGRGSAARGQVRAWTFAGTGRGRTSLMATLLLIGAVAMITETASLGGTMVYQYGVGIKHVSFHSPLVKHKPTP